MAGGLSSRRIALLFRFTVEVLPDGRHVLVDWRYGLLSPQGVGKREEQERALTFVRMYLTKHPDVNVLRLPKGFSKPPDWGSPKPPPERPGWLQEQVEIARAYAAVGETIRRHQLTDEQIAQDLTVRFAIRQAENLKAAALRSVGI